MRNPTHVVMVGLLLGTVAVPVWADDAPTVDPKAKAILEQTARAYRGLHSLEQETTYSSSGTGLGRLLRAKLLVQRPNKLLLELYQRSPEKPNGAVHRYVSDGKSYYTYKETDFSTLQMDNTYTEDKAPRDLAAFKDLTGSLEMAALGGADAFGALLKQARGARVEEAAPVDNVGCDVVSLDIGNADRTGEIRLFLAQSDHLLRKMVYESKEIPKPEPKPDPNVKIDPNELPLDPLEPPKPVHFEYVNAVIANPDFSKGTFTWLKPVGAWRQMNNPQGILNQTRKGQQQPYVLAQPLDTSDVTGASDLSKPTKKVHASDLVKQAQKQRKKAQ